MKISIVIPCYNEGKLISRTHEKLTEVLSKLDDDYELVFVDDGSADNTVKEIMRFSENDPKSKYISFSRNFGKEAAMLAGLRHVTGDAVIIMDSDLQHPPELIPEMIKYYNEGYDQVIAKRNRKGEKFFKTKLSQLYYKIVNGLIDVEIIDGVGDFRLLSRKALDGLLSLIEYNRFSKGLFSWIGFEKKYIEYENQNREEGESKWSFKSLLQYGIDGLISFNNRPLRVIIYIGLFLLLISLGYIAITFIDILMNGISSPGYFTTITSTLIIGGVQLISLGVIGEYIGRIYYEVKKRPNYIINKTNILGEEDNEK